MKSLWALALLMTSSSTAFAGEVDVDAAFLRDDCGHYTETRARFDLTYTDPTLPEDAELRLAYGWEFIAFDYETETRTRLDWQNILGVGTNPSPQHVRLERADDGSWRVTIDQVVHARTSSHPALSGFDFVVERVLASGEIERLPVRPGASFWRVGWDESFSGVPCGSWTSAPLPLEPG